MIGLAILAALLAQPEAIPERLPPVENCSTELGFDEFRARLQEVVANKDKRALLTMLSEDVEVNFGGDHGPALFAANWKFDEPGDSRVWAELEEALSQGCTQSGDALVAPSFVANFPEQLDAFETVILPPGAELHTAKAGASAGKGTLDWHLATVIESADEAWLEVKLADGRQGFVRYDQTVNPLDYRLVFEKRGGEWKIAAFVAGD